MQLEEMNLGRIESPDERDNAYLMSSLLPARLPWNKRRRWRIGPILDQGRTSSCVGQAWKQFLQTTPKPTMDGPTAWDIYQWALHNDEFPGEQDNGTSIRAGARALMEHYQRLKSYVWAWNADDIVNWILRNGPVVIGIPWYEGMFNPDQNGYVLPSGRHAGGHAVLLNAADTTIETVEFPNSWSQRWGINGVGKMRFETLDRLIRERGEACVAIEKNPPKSQQPLSQ